jgi:hypothetical protein
VIPLESPLEGRHQDIITMLLNCSLRPTFPLVLVCRNAIVSPLEQRVCLSHRGRYGFIRQPLTCGNQLSRDPPGKESKSRRIFTLPHLGLYGPISHV